MSEEIKKLQKQLIVALKVEQERNKKADDAQAKYDEKFKEFESQNQDLVDEKLRRDTLKTLIQATVKELRAKSTELLKDGFIDDLPEGFIQKKTIDIIYNRRDMRRAALNHFHHLLILDEKAVHKFIKDNAVQSKHHDDLLIISESIRELVHVDAFNKPLPNISNAKLLRLNADERQD